MAETENEKMKIEQPTQAYVHHFKTPLPYNKTSYQSLTFHWDKLTGKDYLAIERELAAMGRGFVSPEFSSDFLLRMAIRACSEKIGVDAFDDMAIADFNRIRNKARSFLLASA